MTPKLFKQAILLAVSTVSELLAARKMIVMCKFPCVCFPSLGLPRGHSSLPGGSNNYCTLDWNFGVQQSSRCQSMSYTVFTAKMKVAVGLCRSYKYRHANLCHLCHLPVDMEMKMARHVHAAAPGWVSAGRTGEGWQQLCSCGLPTCCAMLHILLSTHSSHK